MTWIVRTLVLVLVLAAPAMAFGGEKHVRLDVEGRVERVRTYATSPAELLERRGLGPAAAVVGEGDSLADGETVRVRHPKTVHLLVDGTPRSVEVRGLTVGQALDELGMATTPADLVLPSQGTPLVGGMVVVLRRAREVSLVVHGEERRVVSSAPTVRELVRGAGVELGGDDTLRPDGAEPVRDGMTVRVVRVERFRTTERVAIPFPTEERPDPDLPKGERRVVQEGAEGVKVLTYEVWTRDGERTAKELASSEVVREPRPRIVRVGTRRPAPDSPSNEQTGIASWYHRDGLTAAHRTLPMGTSVRVTNLSNGRSVTVTIDDRGPFVEGRIIDLSDDAFAEIAALSEGTTRVRIEW